MGKYLPILSGICRCFCYQIQYITSAIFSLTNKHERCHSLWGGTFSSIFKKMDSDRWLSHLTLGFPNWENMSKLAYALQALIRFSNKPCSPLAYNYNQGLMRLQYRDHTFHVLRTVYWAQTIPFSINSSLNSPLQQIWLRETNLITQ